MARRILYGVQATGNGHISRSREIVKALKARGCDVTVVFSGRKREELWDVGDFEPFHVFRGLTFVVKQGIIRPMATALQLHIRELFRDIRSFDPRGYDLVVTDFEPVTARIARRNRIPSLGLGHQYAVRYGLPGPRGGLLDRFIIRFFAPAPTEIGFHWDHFGHPILPPVMPPTLQPSNTVEDDKVLVYLPWEDSNSVHAFLSTAGSHRFVVYTKQEHGESTETLRYRSFSREGFLHDMDTSAGVICNAGFQLMSECIHMGKRLLVTPIQGQFEQESNAWLAGHLGLGTAMHGLKPDVLTRWLDSPVPRRRDYGAVADLVAAWLADGELAEYRDFVESVWRQTGHA